MTGKRFLIIGSGVAGMTCVETLRTLMRSEDSIMLISNTDVLKETVNVARLTRSLETFDVKEVPLNVYRTERLNPYERVTFVQTTVTRLNTENRQVIDRRGMTYDYDILCICSGARPKLIIENHPNVIGLRDLESVQVSQKINSHRFFPF
jgi:pyridine nucleotide-disulfide oxidoreductase domain-containing protein 1